MQVLQLQKEAIPEQQLETFRTKIREMPLHERPRERLARHGAEALSSVELLAIILRTGTRKMSALDLANGLLKSYNLKKLSQLSVAELSRLQGIKAAKACQIAACFELAKRLCNYNAEPRPKIKNSQDVYALLSPHASGLKKECFKCLYLSTKNQLLKEETISVGTLNASVVHPREVFRGAIQESAASIILVHNHPSGDPQPSNDDIELTKKLFESGKLIGINVLDHVIIGDGQFASLKEMGII